MRVVAGGAWHINGRSEWATACDKVSIPILRQPSSCLFIQSRRVDFGVAKDVTSDNIDIIAFHKNQYLSVALA